MIEKDVRKDVRRNRARIVAGARKAFADDGLDASTVVIARQANVGTATLYRHFPTRLDLIDVVFDQEIEHCLSLLEDAARASDPWQGLREAIDAVVDLELAAPGLANRIAASDRSAPLLAGFDGRVQQDLTLLATRLRDEGRARTDLVGADIELLIASVRTIAMRGRTHAKARSRRFSTMMIEGLRNRP